MKFRKMRGSSFSWCCCSLMRTFVCGVLLVSVLAQKDADDIENDFFDPNWMTDYNPFEDPPCEGWNVWDGCSRTPARPKPTPSTPAPNKKPTPTPFIPTTPLDNGQFDQPCDEDETWEAGCLHGGKCYVIEIVDIRSPHCKCLLGWTGIRCEQMDGDFFVLSDDKVKKAGIATGAVAVIIVITVIIVYLVIKRRQRRKKRQAERNQANGHVCKSLIQEGTVVEYPPYDCNYTYSPNEKSETNV